MCRATSGYFIEPSAIRSNNKRILAFAGANPGAVISRHDREIGEPSHPFNPLRVGGRDLSHFEGNFIIDVSGVVKQYAPGTIPMGGNPPPGNLAKSPKGIKC